MSIRTDTIGSLKWTALEQIAVRATTFGVQIVLARLLLPEEFGIVAVVTIVLALVAAFTDGGMGSALIQNKNIDRKDVSTVFVMNLLTSLLLFFAVSFSSDSIARFYEEPRLAPILPFLAFGIVISAFGQTQLQMLMKNLEFKRLLRITMPSTIGGGMVGIVMAAFGFGVWALVAMRMVQAFVQSACVWVFCNPEWRPKIEFYPSSIRKIAGFSLAKLFTDLLYRVSMNLHGLIIGKAFGMASLGFYNRAKSFQTQPISALMTALNRVLFSVFSKNQDDKKKLRRSLEKGVPLLAFVVVPAMFWLMTVAKPLVLVLLTAKWLPSVPLLRVLPLFGIAGAISAPHMNVIDGLGKSKLIVGTAVIKQSLQIGTVCLTWPFGLMAMVIGQVTCAFVNLSINQYVAANCLDDYPFLNRTMAWFRYVLIGAFGFGLGWMVELLKFENQFLLLTAQTIVLLGFYLSATWLAGLPGIAEFVELIRPNSKSRSSVVLQSGGNDFSNG